MGSAREFVKAGILRCFLENYKFSVGGGHTLSFEVLGFNTELPGIPGVQPLPSTDSDRVSSNDAGACEADGFAIWTLGLLVWA